MPLPSWFVVGAMKSGTTSLLRYLQQHPGLYLPDVEEPSWFSFPDAPPRLQGPEGMEASINRTAVTDRAQYEGLYADARSGQLLGDVSPTYMYEAEAAARIKELVPDARIVAILRNPVERAYSAFMHAKREDREPIETFADALAAEPGRIAQGYGYLWRYADMGRYASQIERLQSVFGKASVMVLLTEDLRNDPVTTCQQIATFVGAEGGHPFRPTVRHNVSGVPRSRLVHSLLRPAGVVRAAARPVARVVGTNKLRDVRARMDARNLQRIPLDRTVRGQLAETFRDDVLRLQLLIDRDLRAWLE